MVLPTSLTYRHIMAHPSTAPIPVTMPATLWVLVISLTSLGISLSMMYPRLLWTGGLFLTLLSLLTVRPMLLLLWVVLHWPNAFMTTHFCWTPGQHATFLPNTLTSRL